VAILAFALAGCAEVAGKTEPPVRVICPSFLLSKGYYVVITNTHETVILEGVSIEYKDASGKIKTQAVGVIRPREAKRMDPSEVNWVVERGETI
jgi:hypothetical protein